MKTGFFFEIIQILRDYQNGEFTKVDMLKAYKVWVQRGQLDLVELKTLTGDTLNHFYYDLSGSIRSLEFELKEEKEKSEGKEVEEKERATEGFIEQFEESDVMTKKQVAELCGKSEMWVHKNKKKFKQNRSGVNVKSFLRWLKLYDIRYYQAFRDNFSRG